MFLSRSKLMKIPILKFRLLNGHHSKHLTCLEKVKIYCRNVSQLKGFTTASAPVLISRN